jgi:hypothetical protein
MRKAYPYPQPIPVKTVQSGVGTLDKAGINKLDTRFHGDDRKKVSVPVDKGINKQCLRKCAECGSSVRNDRLERHMKKIHNISLVIPKTFVEHQPSILKYQPGFGWLKTPKTIVTAPKPKPPQQIKQPRNVSKIRAGILAPVKESYLERAVRDIYPLYGKVSFGSDMSKTEMMGIKRYIERFRDVNVYLFYRNYTRYKAKLTNEFFIYVAPKTHPKPWGSWNLDFKNYYTVTDIKEFVIPITDFMFFNTKNKVVVSPHRPLWIIDHC